MKDSTDSDVACYAAVFFCSPLRADELDLYLIGGQSNANGRGDTADIPTGSQLATPQNDVKFYWRKTQTGVINGNLTQNQFIDLQPDSGHGENSPSGHASEFGPELSFGRTLADSFPSRNIGIIKYSEGGTNLHTQWAAGGAQYTEFADVVSDALVELDAAGDTYNLKGMIWLQGEADTSTANSANYEASLGSLIDRVRTDFFEGADAPFVLTDANGQINLGNALGTEIVSLVSVPEPSSTCLLGLLVLAGALRRRK